MSAPALAAPQALLQQERRLIAWLQARDSALVGFSGGVDSCYLAAVALDALGPERTLAVLGRSPSVPDEQWRRASEIAERHGIPLLVIETHELDNPGYAANPANRCYFCKSVLWSALAPLARERAMAVVVDGTNVDDTRDYRPGARAAGDWGVLSPLAELGFTKDGIRQLSRARGLPTWSQPSSPCLASRIPYGTPVTADRLRQVEVAEQALRAIGVEGDLRFRHHGDLARLEVDRQALDHWLDPREQLRLASAVQTAGFASRLPRPARIPQRFAERA